MFSVDVEIPSEIMGKECVVCGTRTADASCHCCPQPQGLCGAEEQSNIFQYVANLDREGDVAYSSRSPYADFSQGMWSAPEETLMLVCPFDGIGGARRALEILGIKPAVYVSIERDYMCARVVLMRWPQAIHFTVRDFVESLTTGSFMKEVRTKCPKLQHGVMVGGPPCSRLLGSMPREMNGRILVVKE